MAFDKTIALAQVIDSLKGVNGRKRLQKIAHLLKSAGFQEFGYDFVLYYYGPFSRELAADLDFLCKAEFVRESPPVNSQTDNTYRYELNAAKAGLVRKVASGGSTEAKCRPRWSALAAALNQQKTPFLEAVSTVVYLRNIGLKGNRLRAAFSRAKPRLGQHFTAAQQYALSQRLMR